MTDDDKFDFAAALSALRFLLEVQYADRFQGRPDVAARVIDELMRLTRVASTNDASTLMRSGVRSASGNTGQTRSMH